MKFFRFIIIVVYCLFVSVSFAQTREKAELDLLKSFKHLNTLIQQKFTDTTGAILDSLNSDDFDIKLADYLQKYPNTIQPFDSLNNEGLAIAASDDGQIKFYTWDSGTGGQQHALNNLCQYKTANEIKIVNSIGAQPYGGPAYIDNIYHFSAADNNYYAVLWRNAVGIKDNYRGIMIFGIQNDSLNTDIRIIKTGTGLHSFLSCYFQNANHNSDGGENAVTEITFDPKKKIIKLPLIDENYQPKSKYIVYQFTGKYFERVKS
jgi:hypothetical protein